MVAVKDKVSIIGMPGCGKTTIGKVIAKELKYNFYDMDEYIENISGKCIKELFNEGEEIFRSWETRACEELLQKNRVIISTGGGVIKRSVNSKILRDFSVVVFIDRDPSNIVKDVDVDSRPLLKSGIEQVYKLYEERYNLYSEAANIRITNDGFIRDVIDDVKRSLNGKIKE